MYRARKISNHARHLNAHSPTHTHRSRLYTRNYGHPLAHHFRVLSHVRVNASHVRTHNTHTYIEACPARRLRRRHSTMN